MSTIYKWILKWWIIDGIIYSNKDGKTNFKSPTGMNLANINLNLEKYPYKNNICCIILFI